MVEHVADERAGRLQVDVAFAMAVPVVDLLQPVAVEDADRELHRAAGLLQLRLQALHEDVEGALVAHRGERVGVREVVQVADVGLHVRDQPVECAGQNADLVVALVVEAAIVVALVHALGDLGQLAQRLGDVAREPHRDQDEHDEQHDRHDDDLVHPALPVGVDLGDGHRDVQPHAVFERQPHGLLRHAFEGVLDEGVVAQQAVRHLRLHLHRGDVHARVVDDGAFRVVDERVAVFVQRDVVDLPRHRGVVDFDADHADELAVLIDRHVVGEHAHAQVVRDVGWQPYGLAGGFRHRVPHERRGVVRVVLRDVGDLVFLEALAVEVDEPEALRGVGSRRIEPVIVGQHAVRLLRHAGEDVLGALEVAVEAVEFRVVEVGLHVGGDHLDGFLDALEVGIEVLLAGLAQQQEHLVGVVAADVPDRDDAEHRGDDHGHDNRTHREQRCLRAYRAHPGRAAPFIPKSPEVSCSIIKPLHTTRSNSPNEKSFAHLRFP